MPITIRGSTSSSLRLGTGNVSNPSLSFANAPDTGFYLTQGNIGFSVAGIEKARVTPSGLVVSGNVSATNFVINGSTVVGAATTLISNVQVANSTYSVLDDTAVSTEGGFLLINGSGFVGGSMVLVGGTPATSTTVLGYTQMGAQIPSKTAGTYSVTVVRPDSVSVNVPLGITYSPSPVWSTSTDLGNVTQNTAFSLALAATSDSNVTYANTSALPPETILASDGTLSGNITSVVDETLYTFQITAQDLELQDVPRTFSLQYFLDFVARKLTATDAAAYDQFGWSVSMSSDGTRVIVGAHYADPGAIGNAGAAYVFTRSGSTWTQESKLIASDKASGDSFGQSVSMSSDGTRVIVGAYAVVSYAGAAYICGYSNGTWVSY